MSSEPEQSERIVPMRLQKFLARAGVASRRGSENLMTAGRVTVNGVVVSELGSRVDPRIDEVSVDGMPVRLSDGPTTIALNKPAGYVTTMSDPYGRPTVAELVPTDAYPGLFPIGRLDADTTGLLLFSTDGDLGNSLLHPSHHVDKTYLALVKGLPSEADIQHLRDGVELDDGLTAPAEVYLLEGSSHCSRLQITVHEGRKRQVKRMCETVGHKVIQLHRIAFGPIELDEAALAQGKWRLLSETEVKALHDAALGSNA